MLHATRDDARIGGVNVRKAFVVGACLLIDSAYLEMRARHAIAAIAVDLVSLLVGDIYRDAEQRAGVHH